jgi:cell wall-associated NlpC family hydrolase
MKTCKKLSVLMLVITSIFMVGCDAAKIMETITKVAEGIQQAAPAIKQVVDTVSNVANSINNNTTTNNNNNEGANNGANVAINNAGDQEDIGGGNNNAGSGTATAQQAAIGRAIRSLLGSTSFRGADVDGGNLACAKVVSTALKNAGALDRVSLNCDAVVSDLRAKGWQRVSVPPYQEGDVVTWTTSRGPGRHIGIIVKEGSSFKAISNSSSQRTPRVHDINYMPITQVLRKV